MTTKQATDSFGGYDFPPTTPLYSLSSSSVLFAELEHFRPVDEERARIAAQVADALYPPPKTPVFPTGVAASKIWAEHILDAASRHSAFALFAAPRDHGKLFPRGKRAHSIVIDDLTLACDRKRDAFQDFFISEQVADALCPPSPRTAAKTSAATFMGELMDQMMFRACSIPTAEQLSTSPEILQKLREAAISEQVANALCPPPPPPRDDVMDMAAYSFKFGYALPKPNNFGVVAIDSAAV